jgi:hypothetical protein
MTRESDYLLIIPRVGWHRRTPDPTPRLLGK